MYVISGDSYRLINEKIQEIIKDSKNITQLDLSVNSVEDVIIEAGYLSMFQEEKYIIVKNASIFGSGKLKEEETDQLLNYLDNPNPLSILIFVCNDKIDSRKKITKLMKEKYQVITMPTLKPYEVENKVGEYFRKQGFKIDNESIKCIVLNSLNNYDIAMNEAEKIILYYDKPCYIAYQDVIKIVSKSLNSNNFLFVDQVVDKNLEKSLELLKDLYTLKVDPSVLISLLARDFRLIYQVKQMLNQSSATQMMKILGLQDWQLDKYIKKSYTYDIKEIESMIEKLCQLDLDIKSGQVDRFMGLELFLLDICS